MIKFKCETPGRWYDEKKQFLLEKTEHGTWVIYELNGKGQSISYLGCEENFKQAKKYCQNYLDMIWTFKNYQRFI